jgi:succinate dehydrogenase / fumarate reductase cytochrome b subunit
MTALTRTAVALWNSSIGKKYVVAITGLVFIGYVAGHLSGNLLIFAGPEAFNEYAEFLHHLGHGAALWVARIVLLTSLVLHVVATIQLTKENRAARVKYQDEDTIQASKSSRIMIFTGLTILAFIIFHILHFTVRVDADLAKFGEDSPWQMVIVGFQNWLVVLFYLIAMSMLCSHLSHGFSSVFQTLGLRSVKTRQILDYAGIAFAFLIWAGFISIPIAIRVFGFGS